jgi:hypothetical protein
MTLKHPGLWRFFILGICVAEGLISTSVVEQLVKPDGWSRASRPASSTDSSGLSATWLPFEEGAQTSLWSVEVYGCASRLCAEQDSTLRVPASLAASAGIITT